MNTTLKEIAEERGDDELKQWNKLLEEHEKRIKLDDEIRRAYFNWQYGKTQKARDNGEKRLGKLIAKDNKLESKARKAEIIEEPSRRKKHKKSHRKQVKDKKRIEVINRDGGKRTVCGRTEHLEVHHIIYKSKGGTDDIDNLITVCDCCHLAKHRGEAVSHLMANKVADRYI